MNSLKGKQIGFLNMLNKKKTIYCIFTFLFIVHNNFIFASDEEVHNTQLKQVLFGRPFTINDNEQKNIRILQKALYLAIDQFNGNKIDYLTDLKEFGVQNLPSFEQIDFSSNQYHQRYTHRGWDFPTYPNQLLWETRKGLLLSTLDKLFNFQENEKIKKDSFGALLYYIHILGDHIGDSKDTYTSRMRLNGSMRGRTMNRSDIIWEFEYHIPRLFREQTNAVGYKTLMEYLRKHASYPSFEYSQTISDDDFNELKKFANEILNTLIGNIPALLKNERFFARVFY